MTTDLQRYQASMVPKEADFQTQVLDLALRYGWEALHVFPAQVGEGKRRRFITPTQGTMAKGWPDLVLLKDGRLIFVELKSATGKLSADQSRVLELLRKIHGAAVETWRPADLEHIAWLLANA